MREKDELDLLLDSALATYADPGPDSGLENRVLASLEGARASGRRGRFFALRRRWVPWVIAVPVAACLLLWMAIGNIKHAPSVQPGQVFHAERTPVPPRFGEPAIRSEAVRKHPQGAKARVDCGAFSARLMPPQRRRPVAGDPGTSCPVTKPPSEGVSVLASAEVPAALPKLDVFPSPQPLTPEERTLVVVATQTSLPVREALAQAQIQDETPVRIAAIHIPPLQPPDPGQP